MQILSNVLLIKTFDRGKSISTMLTYMNFIVSTK